MQGKTSKIFIHSEKKIAKFVDQSQKKLQNLPTNRRKISRNSSISHNKKKSWNPSISCRVKIAKFTNQEKNLKNIPKFSNSAREKNMKFISWLGGRRIHEIHQLNSGGNCEICWLVERKKLQNLSIIVKNREILHSVAG